MISNIDFKRIQDLIDAVRSCTASPDTFRTLLISNEILERFGRDPFALLHSMGVPIDNDVALPMWRKVDLDLSLLRTISCLPAAGIASWQGESLCLNGLKTLEPTIARILAKWNGRLVYLD